MPAAPTMGLILLLGVKMFSTLTNSTPTTESSTKATRPRPIIMKVSGRTNWSAFMEKEMVMPSSRVMRLARSFWAVLDRVDSTPHSRIRLPNMRKPTSATEAGATSPAITVTTMGKKIRIRRVTPWGR